MPNHPTCRSLCKPIHVARQVLLTRGGDRPGTGDGLVVKLIAELEAEGRLDDEVRAVLSGLSGDFFRAANKINAAGRRVPRRDGIPPEKTRSGWRGQKTERRRRRDQERAALLAEKRAAQAAAAEELEGIFDQLRGEVDEVLLERMRSLVATMAPT